jgi:hypothetical protein
LKSVLKWILRGWLAVSGDGQPPKFDNIVSALRKSTVAPCHQDEQVFDAQRTGSADPGLRRNRAPDTPLTRAAQYFIESSDRTIFVVNLRSAKAP